MKSVPTDSPKSLWEVQRKLETEQHSKRCVVWAACEDTALAVGAQYLHVIKRDLVATRLRIGEYAVVPGDDLRIIRLRLGNHAATSNRQDKKTPDNSL